jgi:hypothetical protein
MQRSKLKSKSLKVRPTEGKGRKVFTPQPYDIIYALISGFFKLENLNREDKRS